MFEVIGSSRLGLPLEAWFFGDEDLDHRVLILGGVHGDEIEGVVAALSLLDRFQRGFELPCRVILIPRFNTDGVLLKTRVNHAGVDLNRNLPTRDWQAQFSHPRYYPGPKPLSEPENQALVAILDQVRPDMIISLHSWYPVLNVNGSCQRLAQHIAKKVGYRIDPDIGYPTPGSLGTYAGLERGIPTLTYEIERGSPLEKVISLHSDAIIYALKQSDIWERASQTQVN